jgi:hypothetical protein
VVGIGSARAALMYDWMRHDKCPHCGTSIQGLNLFRHIQALTEDEVHELSIPIYLTGEPGGHVAEAHWELSGLFDEFAGWDVRPVDEEVH